MKHVSVYLLNGDEHCFTCDEIKKETIGNDVLIKFVGTSVWRYIQSNIVGFKETEETENETDGVDLFNALMRTAEKK